MAIYWKPVIEILILWSVIYHIMLFFEGTRAINVVRGIVILAVAFLLSQKFGFHILDWLLSKLFGISVIALLIIFHPEIRNGLARLGQRHSFGRLLREEEMEHAIKETLTAAEILSKDRIGAIIAIEMEEPLNPYIESGVVLDARPSSELIQTVFTPKSLLHDGGLIIQHGKIAAAGCLFPLTDKPDISRIFGTRHRAAIGLSEETDAVVIVVSEERQDISLVYHGRLHKDLSREAILSKIIEILKSKNG